MSISFPRTDVFSVDMAEQTFRLVQRQEYSTQANGVVRGKDLGSALWMAEFRTVPLPADDAIAYEALLNSLDGVVNTFEAGDLRRPYPRSYSDGSFNDTGTILSIGSNDKSLRITNLPANFALSVGDYFCFDYGVSPSSRALHQAVEAVTATAGGTTANFEVRPHIRNSELLSPSPDIGVTLKNPTGIFMLVPDSISSQQVTPLIWQISFKAIQAL